MPPGDGVTVNPADLVSHAGHVAAVAAEVATAAQAGAATRPGPEAYGKLCVIVPVLLGQLQGMVVDGMEEAERSLRDTAARLRDAAAGYRDADGRAASAVLRAGTLPWPSTRWSPAASISRPMRGPACGSPRTSS